MPENTMLTYEDLAAFPDDGLRRELLDGELLVSPSPVRRHQRIVGRLFLSFGVHIQEHGGGEAFVAPFDVLLSNSDVVEPDLVFVADDQMEISTEKNIQGAPALLIEVISDPRTDRVRKRDVYARRGVPEYWIVDPDSDRVEVLRLNTSGGGYAKPVIFEAGDTLIYDRLPGLSIDVAALLAR